MYVITEPVVNLSSPVNTDHNVVHFPVEKGDFFLVKQDSVGGKSKVKPLVVPCGHFFTVIHRFFYHFIVEQRFTTEEINLDIIPRGMVHQEIYSLKGYLGPH